MKELDILLESFLAANERELRAGSWPEFERFLDLEDDLLWDSLRQPAVSASPEFQSLIKAIRNSGSQCA
jgi:succinate dehydrogenase flavin-adding protein (antitoxin of CptAB toxin-antitoxin module)